MSTGSGYREEQTLFRDLFEVSFQEVRTKDPLVLKLYSSQLLLSLLDRFEKDSESVERHRPYISALVDSLLYALNGCIDALLQDVREGLALKVKPRHVAISEKSDFIKQLKRSEDPRAKQEIKWIEAMRDDTEHWLYVLREYRNKSAHREPIAWLHKRPIEVPSLVCCDQDIISYFRMTLSKLKRHCGKVRKRYHKYVRCPALGF